MSSDRDWRRRPGAPQQGPSEPIPTPGKHSNTEFYGTGILPKATGPGKVSATEALPEASNPWQAVGVDTPPADAGDAAALAIGRKSTGEPVNQTIAAAVGAQTSADVTGARVHRDALSQTATHAMNARAFAYGSDVFLGPGESVDDPGLMGHELAHVAQNQLSGAAPMPQSKAAIGEADSPAERHADRVADSVQAGAPATTLIVDRGTTTQDQMVKDQFLALLKPQVVAVANDELGRLGSALACPYIEQYFAKYAVQPAAAAQAMIHRWVPSARNARTARDLVPLILERVRSGVRTWTQSGQLPPELAAADPALATNAVSAHPQTAQTKTLEAMEQRLGPGEPADPRLATPLGAEGARVHTGATAAAMAAEHNAVAFAVGQNVVMGSSAPQRGTTEGDALLAHELAHTAQQKSAATDASARRAPIGDESQVAERDADRAAAQALSNQRLAALGNFAGQVGDVMRTGVQLQRCAQPAPKKVTTLHGKDAAAKLAELGGSLRTDPDYSDGRKAVAGSHLQYTLYSQPSPQIQMGMYQWTHDGPDGYHMQSIPGVGRPDPIPSAAVGPNGMFINAHNVGATTIPISKPGKYTTDAWVRVGVDNNGTLEGYDLHVEHSVEAQSLDAASKGAWNALGHGNGKDASESFQKFHDTMDMQMAVLRPGDPSQQNKGHQMQVATSAPNPAQASTAQLTYTAQDARTDKSKSLTYHWYVSPQTKDDPPATFAGKSVAVVGTRKGYDFGTAASISIPSDLAGLWVVWYQAKDSSGADAGEGTYLQTILGPDDMKALEKLDKYMEHLNDLGGKIEGEQVPIVGVHVSQANANETRLRLFIGKKKGDPSKLLLIDVTPGLDPKANRLEYESSSGQGVIDQFIKHNKYPKGRMTFVAVNNQIGVPTNEQTQDTDGQGAFDRLSTGLSVGGMVALGLGIIAAPFTRGQSLQVAIVLASGLTAAGSALSLYEKLQHAEVDEKGVALDAVMIASSIINGGGAIRALKQGPAVLLASRTTRFLLWANFTADAVSGLLISVEGAEQLAAIIDDKTIPEDQKRSQIVRIVTNLVMAGAMLAVSHGQLHEFRTKVKTAVGEQLAKQLGDEVCMALAMLDEATLKSLAATKEAKDLTKLAGAIREEPGIINVLKGESRLAKILPLMKGASADDLKFAIMRENAHQAGVSVVNSERLAAVLKDANFDSSAAMNIPSDSLTGLGNGNLLDELEKLGPLAKSGKVQNYEAWLKDLATKRGKGVAAAIPWAQEARASAATAADPVDMNKPWGIDFDAWKARLKAQGIKGDIDAIIERAKGGGPDAIAARGELRGAERAHARGNEVEMITPPAGKGAAQGELSPEAKLTQGGQEKAFEQKTATAPPDRKTWNAHADKANKQIKAAKRPGEISFDWTEVALTNSDFPSASEIEGFLNGKMTKERLKEVRYFEIVWKDSKGQTWITSRTRGADGALSAVTTVRQ